MLFGCGVAARNEGACARRARVATRRPVGVADPRRGRNFSDDAIGVLLSSFGLAVVAIARAAIWGTFGVGGCEEVQSGNPREPVDSVPFGKGLLEVLEEGATLAPDGAIE